MTTRSPSPGPVRRVRRLTSGCLASGCRRVGAVVVLACVLQGSGFGVGRGHAADPRLTSEVAGDTVGSDKQTMLGLYLTSQEAADALARHSDIVLIDVRARAAVLRDGLAAPTRRNIPLFAPTPREQIEQRDAAPMRIDPEFLTTVETLVGQGEAGRRRTVLVICPDGSHSALAVDHLADHGFSNVYLIVDGAVGQTAAAPGAIGWKRLGLPWLAAPTPDQIAR